MRRVAFLVGNSKFEPRSGLGALRFPVADVEALAEVLMDRDIGRYDRVETLLERSKEDILASLAEVFDSERGASILFYYSGHGMISDSGRLFLAASNTTDRLLPANGISFAGIFEIKDDYGCGRFCAILDCCYAGLGSTSVRGAVDERLKGFADGKGIFFLGAANATVAAREDPVLGHGILTAGIIEGLSTGLADVDKDGRITGPDLFAWCRDYASRHGSHRPVQKNQVADDDLVIAFSPFAVLTKTFVSRPREILKHNDTFVAIDDHGDIGVSSGKLTGLFHSRMRYLSRLELLINETPPRLGTAKMLQDNSACLVELTNPDLFYNNKIILAQDLVYITRVVVVGSDVLYQRLNVRNYSSCAIDLRISLLFESDFADLNELRDLREWRHREITSEQINHYQVLLQRCENTIPSCKTLLTFSPKPERLTKDIAVYDLHLAPQATKVILVSAACDLETSTPPTFFSGFRAVKRDARQMTYRRAAVETPNESFGEILSRSAADLSMLMTNTTFGRHPYASLPLDAVTIGHDGLITALQMLWWEPEVARSVLLRLASTQAKSSNPRVLGEPGEIIHEMHSGETGASDREFGGRYYRSVELTPLFVMLAGAYLQRTGDEKIIGTLWPYIQAAMDWIDVWGDRDGDGFVESTRAIEEAPALTPKGWRSSHDSVHHSDGSLAEGPVALSEVQGYVYAATVAAKRCAQCLGRPNEAAAFAKRAEVLRRRFDDYFWCDDLQTYAMALDGNKRPCKVRASSAGQALFTGIALRERASCIARGLRSDDLFSGWGVRTLARSEKRYNPISLFNGSIWPHDNALIALGLSYYGLSHDANLLFNGLYSAANLMSHRRLPELFSGVARYRGSGPSLYPSASLPHACASAALFAMLGASLGISFDPPSQQIIFRDPHLPSFLNELMLSNLAIPSGSVSVAFRRSGRRVVVDVLSRRGPVRVVTVD